MTNAVPCPNCNSTNLEYSIGALFEGANVFCVDCGCEGGMSKTKPACPDLEKRKAQALANWNEGLIERTCYTSRSGSKYFWPPVKYFQLSKEEREKLQYSLY